MSSKEMWDWLRLLLVAAVYSAAGLLLLWASCSPASPLNA